MIIRTKAGLLDELTASGSFLSQKHFQITTYDLLVVFILQRQ